MLNDNLSFNSQEVTQFDDIRRSLLEGSGPVKISGRLKLTKTPADHMEIFVRRENQLENTSRSFLSQHLSVAEVLKRYQRMDPSFNLSHPEHYPVSIISGYGAAASGKNIFMVFPECGGSQPGSESEVFGIEFIDMWEAVFNQIVFPCTQLVFPHFMNDQRMDQFTRRLREITYIASYFHEVGHRVGPYRLVNSSLRLTSFKWEVLTELATDMMLILNLAEIDDLPLFLILQRIFWYGRRGFAQDQKFGSASIDNDTWIGIFLWSRLFRDQLISKDGEKIYFDQVRILKCCSEILDEINEIGAIEDPVLTEIAVEKWMNAQMPREENSFLIPEELKKAFIKCLDVPEFPKILLPQFDGNDV